MPTTLYISGGGSIVHLINSSGVPNESAPDVSTAATTPCMVVGNGGDVWTPQAPQPRDIFTDDLWVARSYQPITETIHVLIKGTFQTCYLALASLQSVLSASTHSRPAALVLQQSAAFNAEISQVLNGYAQPVPGVNTTMGSGVDHMFVDITLTRSPYWAASTMQTVLSATSVTNNAVQAIGSLTTDYDFEGSPINVSWTRPASTPDPVVLYLATIQARIQNSGGTVGYNTSSTGYTAYALPVDLGNAYRDSKRLKLRPIIVITTLTQPSKTSIYVGITASGGPFGTVGQAITLGSNTTAQIVDGGMFDPDWLRAPNNTGSTMPITVYAYVASTDGTNVIGTMSAYVLVYYDFCALTTNFTTSATHHYELNSVTPYSVGTAGVSTAWMPMQPRFIVAANTTNVAVAPGVIRGTAIRHYSGASLWAAWYGANRAFVAADTATFSSSGASLFKLFRF